MNRPFLLQLLPESLRLSVWFRLYASKYHDWLKLYEAASLSYAKEVRLKLLPGDHISGQIAFTGFYELSLTRRLIELSKRGGTMVDIGANIGYFSCLWASGNAENKCFAFEASPRNIGILQTNITNNNFDKQITLFPLAAGFEAGSLNFEAGPEDQTGWGGFATTDSSTSIEVNVVRVDQNIPFNIPIDLLKVDIEGADTWALMGCEDLLKQHLVKEVWYEQNKPRMRLLGIKLEQAQEFLESLGYKCFPQDDVSREVVEWRAVPINKLPNTSLNQNPT